jgi:hypothetical protein
VHNYLSTLTWERIGDWRYSSTILNRALDEGECQLHASAALTPEISLRFSLGRRLVGPTASLDGVEKVNMSTHVMYRTTAWSRCPSLVTIPTAPPQRLIATIPRDDRFHATVILLYYVL